MTIGIYNRQEIETSERCGCFHCINTFHSNKVIDWTDDGETAVCPGCGVDSMVGDSHAHLYRDFLLGLQEYFFSRKQTELKGEP